MFTLTPERDEIPPEKVSPRPPGSGTFLILFVFDPMTVPAPVLMPPIPPTRTEPPMMLFSVLLLLLFKSFPLYPGARFGFLFVPLLLLRIAKRFFSCCLAAAAKDSLLCSKSAA